MVTRHSRHAVALTTLAVIAGSVWAMGTMSPAHAANVTSVSVTVTNAAGTAVPNAFAAVMSTSGVALGGGVTNSSGVATIAITSTDNASLAVKAGSPNTGSVNNGTVDTSGNSAVQLPAAAISTGLTYANTFGAQVRRIAGDADSGTFYATTDNIPAVWRTTDYGGTWAPVPTKANDAANGLPQETASQIVTSGYPGEVAVAVQSGVYYSRDFGSTWSAVTGLMVGNNDSLMWAHSAIASGTDSSYLFAHGNSGLLAAAMPSSANGVASPSLAGSPMTAYADASTTPAVRYSVAPQVSTGKVFLLASGIGKSTVYQLTSGQTSGSGIQVTTGDSATFKTVDYGVNSGTDDLTMVSTLGSSSKWGFVLYDRTGGGSSSATLRTVYLSTAGTLGAATASTGSTAVANNVCGENETTPVGAIINGTFTGASPAPYTSKDFAGAIRGCSFTATGTTVATSSINGINNNTGFVFDSGFLSTNQVAIAGDGQFGLRKSASIAAGLFSFGDAGGQSQNASYFLQNQAESGDATTTSGIAVTGMVNPVVKDLAYSPNDTTGSTYVVSTSSTGGSQMLLTTNGGQAFSTMSGSGSDQIAWWNGTGSNQWIVGGAPLSTSQFFRVKQFTATNGTGPLDMGEELAATAAQRNDWGGGLYFVQPNNAATFSGNYGTSAYGTSMGNGSLTALEGVPGYNRAVVGISSGSAGTVSVLDFGSATNTGDQDAVQPTITAARYFGTAGGYTGTGSTTSPATAAIASTFSGAIKSIAVCPNSSGVAADVRDTAFISVEGAGIYKLTSVSSSPTLVAPTAHTTATFTDLKIDCDTGIMVAGSSLGLSFSLDGVTFQQISLPVAQAPLVQSATAVAVSASATADQLTIGVGAGNDGNITSVAMALTDVLPSGTTIADLQAGTATTPVSPVQATAGQVDVINNAQATNNVVTEGKDIGQIPSLDFPEGADSVVRGSAFHKIMIKSARRVSYRTSSTISLAIGSGAGSFASSATNNSGGGGTPDNGGGSSGGGSSSSSTTTTTTTPAPQAPSVVESIVADPGKTTPSEFATLTPSQVASLPASAFGQLPSSVYAAITPSQFEAVSPSQIASMPPSGIGTLNPAVFEVMTPTQVRALSPAAVAYVTRQQAGELQPTTARALSWRAPRISYAGSQLRALKPTAVSGLTPSAIRILIARQVAAIQPAAFATMQPGQTAVLGPKQVTYLTADQIKRWSPAAVKKLRPATLAALSPAQANAFTERQLKAMSATQLKYLG